VTPEERREYHRRWCAANPDKCKGYTRKYRAKNPHIARIASKKWIQRNPEKRRAIVKNWTERNREKVRADYRARIASDPAFRLRKNLGARLVRAVHSMRARKSASTLGLTGCDMAFLMGYIEAKFTHGMTWANYGSVWELDHRIPCASFDLTDPSHQRSCFHYTNLQPLLVFANRSKHAKVPVS